MRAQLILLRYTLQEWRTASRFVGDEPLTSHPARTLSPEPVVRAFRSLRALPCCLPAYRLASPDTRHSHSLVCRAYHDTSQRRRKSPHRR